MKKSCFLIALLFLPTCGVQEPEDENDSYSASKAGTSEDVSESSTSSLSLYAQHCASCHGEVSESRRLGSLPSEIISAIENQPQMQHLSFLTEEQIDEISDELNLDYED